MPAWSLTSDRPGLHHPLACRRAVGGRSPGRARPYPLPRARRDFLRATAQAIPDVPGRHGDPQVGPAHAAPLSPWDDIFTEQLGGDIFIEQQQQRMGTLTRQAGHVYTEPT